MVGKYIRLLTSQQDPGMLPSDQPCARYSDA